MNLYEVLRRLIKKAGFSELETKDMLAVIHELEITNSFGDVAVKQIQEHQCVFMLNKYTQQYDCLYCHKLPIN